MRPTARVSANARTMQRLFDSMVNRDKNGRPVLILTPRIDDGLVLADALMERGYGKLGEALSKRLEAQQKRSPGWDSPREKTRMRAMLHRLQYTLNDLQIEDRLPVFSKHDSSHMTRLARKIISPPLRTRDRLEAFVRQGGYVGRQAGTWKAHDELGDLLEQLGYDKQAKALRLAWAQMLGATSQRVGRGVMSYQSTLARLGIFV